MLKISLIQPPFAKVELPSLALTQLKAAAEERLGDRVRIQILYLNHDFARFLGLDLYHLFGVSCTTGLGDWFFRRLAFPEAEDNSRRYLRRFLPLAAADPPSEERRIRQRRAELGRFVDRLIARYRLASEDLIGLSSVFCQNLACLALARRLKARNPEILILMGGANCEAPMGPRLVRLAEAVDFVFSGPALSAFPRFLGHVLSGEFEKCHRLPGVFSSRSEPDKARGHQALGEEVALGLPPAGAYDGFLDDFGRNFPDAQVAPVLAFETSRGCWWGERSHCKFCGLNGSTMAYRSLSPEQALELLRQLFAAYGERCRRFEAVDNILPRNYLREVFPHLETPPQTVIFYEVKADLKGREIEALTAAGVTEVQPGIEALATATLKRMGKGTTAFQNLTFLKRCRGFGLTPHWNLLIGFPGEPEAVYRKYRADIPKVTHLPPPLGVFLVRFDRYSPYYSNAREHGLELSPYDFYHYLYPIPEEALRDLAYFFEDRDANARHRTGLLAWHSELDAAVGRWRRLWQGASKPELRLEPRGASAVIRDSRSGKPVEHRPGSLGLEILHLLRSRGRGLGFLSRRLQADEAVIAGEVARLRQLGLVFEENERFLSLVLEPSAPQRDDPP